VKRGVSVHYQSLAGMTRKRAREDRDPSLGSSSTTPRHSHVRLRQRSPPSAIESCDTPDDEPTSLMTPCDLTLDQKIGSCRKLLELREHQQGLLLSRRLSLCGKPQRARACAPNEAEDYSLSVSQRWRLYISTLSPHFFHESTLSSNESPPSDVAVRTAYEGLRLNEDNNEDVAEIFKKKWKAKAIRGQSILSYTQFRSCAGQFARFCVTLGIVEAHKICERGMLLRLVCESSVVEGFVGFFQTRAMSSTICSKATILTILSREAWGFFASASDEVTKNKARDVNDYLKSVSSAEKTETRREARGRRHVSVRAQEGRLFLPFDFERCIRSSSLKLKGIMESATCNSRSWSSVSVYREFRKRPGIVQKWNINFIALLMLTAGGQRPQVFGQLRCPDGLELEEARRALSGPIITSSDAQAVPEQYFELGTVLEKRSRTSQLPNVIFPAMTFPFVEFHCTHIRPFIVGECERKSIDPASAELEFSDEPTILIHTKTGSPLYVEQVRRTWKSFLQTIDPELSKVTPMVLRSSFATYAIQRYRNGEMFSNLSEELFFDRLGAMMNTSSQMLRDVYGGCDPDDYRATAIEMMKIYGRDLDDDIARKE
jgi:hypothetical protein